MQAETLEPAIKVHQSLHDCAHGIRGYEEISNEIHKFAASELAPDASVLSNLLLDTLFLYDSAVSAEDNEALSQQRERLGNLIVKLIDAGCIIEQDAFERLEPPLLYAARLIPDSKLFEKRQIRINTTLLYKQQKFNLLREESEGYAKLIVEFDAFLSTVVNISSEAAAHQLLNNIQSLIGYFDLDPNRVLDIVTDLVSANLLTHWRFLIGLLKVSPWFIDNGQEAAASSTIKADLEYRGGNRAAAQIIGFKFQQTKQLEEDQPLIMLTALLIKEGLLRLQDLWPHLAPDDATLAKEKAAYQDRIMIELDKAKGRNALAMAGGLDEEPTKTADATMVDSAGGSDLEPLREETKQKIALLYAMLSIGALPECLFVLSESRFLLDAHTHLAEAFVYLVERIVEPLWDILRLHRKYSQDTLRNLQQFKRVPEFLKFRDSTLVLPKEPETELVLDPRQQIFNSKKRQVFFYDQVDSHLNLCHTFETFESTVLPLLRLAGVQIYRNVTLCTKLARIGKAAISETTDSERPRQLWQSILRISLLPALSLLGTNPAIVSDIFQLAKEFPTEQRYALYGEWFTDMYKRIPELKVQFVKTEKETKSLLRRISKTNTKEYGRRLAKVSHANPCIVLNIALNQIESYDNLVDVVIEASRYFTLLTFDVLVYIMLTLLSNTQKRRLKEDGTSVAHWLQSLSSFAAKIFKRYSHMDVSPILAYVAKQIKMNNAFDLIILRDLINEMAGIRPTSDLSEEQLLGCSGGPYLRVEALSLINERKDATAKAPARLLYALEKVQLTYAFPILIGQQRSYSVYNVPEEQSLLKLLANLADEVHQILLQYLEFLTINTVAKAYEESIFAVSDMVRRTALEPCVAFMIARPAVSARLHAYLEHSIQAPLKVQPHSNGALHDMSQSDIVASETEENKHAPDRGMDISKLEAHGSRTISSVLEELSQYLVDVLPDIIWSTLQPRFYAIFWSLSLYDLAVPTTRYNKEISSLTKRLSELESDRIDPVDWVAKTKEAEVDRVRDLTANIAFELEKQNTNAKVVSEYLLADCKAWFKIDEPSGVSDQRMQTAKAVLQHCLLPRCMVSPNDASYCAKFLIKLQNSPSCSLDLVTLYKLLFGSQLATTVFCCTEREAENLGRFLGSILEALNETSENEDTFQATTFSSSLVESSSPECESGVQTMSWKQFNTTWYDSFHRAIWASVKACFESKEYMHVRNILIVLEKMHTSFPYFKWIGNNIEKEVDRINVAEKREDLKIRALGYKAVLRRQRTHWHEVPGKQAIAPSVSQVTSLPEIVSENRADQTPSMSESLTTTITADTQPTVPGQADINTQPVASSTRAAGQASSIVLETSDQQKENARLKAAALSQQLRNRSRSSGNVLQESVSEAKSPHARGTPANTQIPTKTSTDNLRNSEVTAASRSSSPARGMAHLPSEHSPSSAKRKQIEVDSVSKTQDDRNSTGLARNSLSPDNSRSTEQDRHYQRQSASRHGHSDVRPLPSPTEYSNGRLNDSQGRRHWREEVSRRPSTRSAEDQRRGGQPTSVSELHDHRVSDRDLRQRSGDVPSGPRYDIRDKAGSSNHESRSTPSERPRSTAETDRARNPAPDMSASRTGEYQERPQPGRDDPSGVRNGSRESGTSRVAHQTTADNPDVPSANPPDNSFVHPSRLASGKLTQQILPQINTNSREAQGKGASDTEQTARPSRQPVTKQNQAIRTNQDNTSHSSGLRSGQWSETRPPSTVLPPPSNRARDNIADNHRASNDRDGRGGRHAKEPDSQVSRDSRPNSRELRQDIPRAGLRGSDRANFHQDRSDRGERHQDREERRDRPVVSRASREEHESKRRHVTDSRDMQRPTKRR